MSMAQGSSPAPARHLVLLGAGATHRHLVKLLARNRLPSSLPCTWLVEAGTVLPLDWIAPCIAGELEWAQTEQALAPLAAAAGLRLLIRHTVRIDAATRSIELDGQERLAFDFLSIDAEPVQDRNAIEGRRPGAREHSLFACPPTALAGLWPRVNALPPERLRSTAVIGDAPLALEIAFALRSARPASAISLVTAAPQLLPGAGPAALAALAGALRRASIDVLPEEAVGVEPGALRLASGAVLRCDMPVIADGLGDPAWLSASGLAQRPAAPADLPPALQPAPAVPIFMLPWHGSPGLARWHLANLLRAAQGRPLRLFGAPQRSWHALWMGPGQALAFGRGWQVAGRIGFWLLRWHRR